MSNPVGRPPKDRLVVEEALDLVARMGAEIANHRSRADMAAATLDAIANIAEPPENFGELPEGFADSLRCPFCGGSQTQAARIAKLEGQVEQAKLILRTVRYRAPNSPCGCLRNRSIDPHDPDCPLMLIKQWLVEEHHERPDR